MTTPQTAPEATETGPGTPLWLRNANHQYGRVEWFIDATRAFACVYCGDIATDRDHLYPNPWTGREWRSITPTVPACGDCNRRLSDVLTNDLEERCAHVAQSLRRKHKDLLGPRRFVAVDELSRTLRDFVEAKRAARSALLRRLDVLDRNGALWPIDCDQIPVILTVELDDVLDLEANP